MKCKFIFGIILLLSVSNVFAVNTWYHGKVKNIITSGSDGSFIIYTDNTTLNSICIYDRVYFRVSDMGQERTKVALTMALTAFTANKDWGVVVDLPVEPESICYASSSASQGAGIR